MDENQQNFYQEYEPLKWPPDMNLAELHMKCSCPGRDNVEGGECPCCGRFEKMRIRNWLNRDIAKDFKHYGGGVSAYFEMMKYCGVCLMVSLLLVGIHIYALESTCSSGLVKCPTFFWVFKFLPCNTIYTVLRKMGRETLSDILLWLQLGTFLFLILVTIGMKWFLHYINSRKVTYEEKVYSQYSLMIKNVPVFYQIDDIRKQILQIVPSAEICELFFVHEIATLETKSKKLLDLHFQIKFLKHNILQDRGGSQSELQELKSQYRAIYDEVDTEKKKLNISNGRAIIVLNRVEDRNAIYKKLRINECQKIFYNLKRLVGESTTRMHFYADKIAEPQEIMWNYIGENSVSKTKVRLETTSIGLGFILLCFMVLYFPIVYSDEAKINDKDGIGAWLSLVIAVVIQILSIVYRLIILRLIPSRQPSSRESESYFIVITTVIFHFFFYLVAPACYYVFATKIPSSIKLFQLFITVMIFLAFTTLVAIVDIRYRIFNSRRKKTMASWAFWGRLCQIRLHEEIRYPSFPIEFKLMILLKIWAFNAFYIFQIPYVILMFILAFLIIYWNDKKNIYTHYKMQSYLSIDLEHAVLRDYTYMFLLCVSVGYAISAIFTWQYIFIAITFSISILINIMVSFQNKLHSKNDSKPQSQITKTLTLGEIISSRMNNPKESMLYTIRENEMKENLFMVEGNLSNISLGSISYQFGYREIYENYLQQFKNRHFHQKLEQAYNRFGDEEDSGRVSSVSSDFNVQGFSIAKVRLSRESQLKELNISYRQSKGMDQNILYCERKGGGEESVQMGQKEDEKREQNREEEKRTRMGEERTGDIIGEQGVTEIGNREGKEKEKEIGNGEEKEKEKEIGNGEEKEKEKNNHHQDQQTNRQQGQQND